MTTHLSTKFAALAVALTLNSLTMGGFAYLFTAQWQFSPPLAAAGRLPGPAAV